MIAAIVVYLAAFALAWAPVITRGFPWTLLLLSCPTAWIAGVVVGRPSPLAIGLYGVVGVAVWAAFSGAFFPALSAVVLALVAWDAAGLYLWLRRADEVTNRARIWQSLMITSCALASAGAALALGFAQLELPLPFWAMVPLLLAAWGSLAALRRAASQRDRWGVSAGAESSLQANNVKKGTKR